MSTPFTFPSLTAETAPAAARPILAGSAKQFGFVPTPVARVAHAPATLKHLLASLAAFEQTSLSPIEREVVDMSVAWENACTYCMAMHTAMLASAPEHAATVAALRSGSAIPDARLETLRQFVRAVMHERGRVPAPVQGALREAGFTEAQALEIILGVGAYQLSTMLNIFTGSEIDAPFAAFAWERPGQPVLLRSA